MQNSVCKDKSSSTSAKMQKKFASMPAMLCNAILTPVVKHRDPRDCVQPYLAISRDPADPNIETELFWDSLIPEERS